MRMKSWSKHFFRRNASLPTIKVNETLDELSPESLSSAAAAWIQSTLSWARHNDLLTEKRILKRVGMVFYEVWTW